MATAHKIKDQHDWTNQGAAALTTFGQILTDCFYAAPIA
jgi:hypothetical protein